MNDPFQKQTFQPSNFETELCPHCNFPNRVTDTYCKYCEIPLQPQEMGIYRRGRMCLRRILKTLGELRWKDPLEKLKGKVYWLIGLFFLVLGVYLLL